MFFQTSVFLQKLVYSIVGIRMTLWDNRLDARIWTWYRVFHMLFQPIFCYIVWSYGTAGSMIPFIHVLFQRFLLYSVILWYRGFYGTVYSCSISTNFRHHFFLLYYYSTIRSPDTCYQSVLNYRNNFRCFWLSQYWNDMISDDFVLL